LLPIAVFLKVAGNVLAGEAFRAAAHSLQYLAGDSFVNTQSLHSTHKLVMQLTCPLNLHHTSMLLNHVQQRTPAHQRRTPKKNWGQLCRHYSKPEIKELLLWNTSATGLHPYCMNV